MHVSLLRYKMRLRLRPCPMSLLCSHHQFLRWWVVSVSMNFSSFFFYLILFKKMKPRVQVKIWIWELQVDFPIKTCEFHRYLHFLKLICKWNYLEIWFVSSKSFYSSTRLFFSGLKEILVCNKCLITRSKDSFLHQVNYFVVFDTFSFKKIMNEINESLICKVSLMQKNSFSFFEGTELQKRIKIK